MLADDIIIYVENSTDSTKKTIRNKELSNLQDIKSASKINDISTHNPEKEI